MVKLFDKVTGTTTSFDSAGVSDSSASFRVDEFKDYFVLIDSIEYKIISNTATKLLFTNTIAANFPYTIQIVGRSFLTEIESDAANTVKITDDLILKKFNQTNTDLSNRVFAYLKGLFDADFDPLENILNLVIIQTTFSYLLLSKIYQDLMIDEKSFEGFKGYNMYQKNYDDGVKDALALLQVDFNEDGEISAEEKNKSASTFKFFSR